MRRFVTRPIWLGGLLLLLLLLGGRAKALTTTVYGDVLTAGWANWSWASVNLASPSPTHSGSASIAVTYTGGWQGLYLAYPAGFETTAFTRLRFYLHGGGSGGQQLQLYAVLAGGGQGPAVSLPAPVANSWSEVRISLADLGAANGTLTGLVWQDSSGGSQPTFYLDNLAFSDDANPSGPVFGQVSLPHHAVPADGSSQVVVKAEVSDPQGLGDIAAVTLNRAPLGRGEIPLRDDGRHNDGSAGDGLFGAVVSVAPGPAAGEVTVTLTARDQAGHQSTAHWQVNSGVPWDYVYQTAPNALVAPHASMWATNTDPNIVPAAEVAGLAQSTVAFMAAMGGTAADLYFVEWIDWTFVLQAALSIGVAIGLHQQPCPPLRR